MTRLIRPRCYSLCRLFLRMESMNYDWRNTSRNDVSIICQHLFDSSLSSIAVYSNATCRIQCLSSIPTSSLHGVHGLRRGKLIRPRSSMHIIIHQHCDSLTKSKVYI